MRIFKVRWFQRWAAKERLTDDALRYAVDEIERGLVDANLGGNVYKKRVGAAGRGKSSGWRTIVAIRNQERIFFMYGFAKSERSNIRDDELRLFKLLAMELVAHDDAMLLRLISDGELYEVIDHE